ncbi:uncharacterized protein LOC121784089 [Salvia splendens]|uniref:uncharacterized protein LOC121784089 n=1 Tax=Salvia splendens TaxID=180675 RepID=UPI001C279E5F|nr:uncharacterized protein LOC121784089 [Salvia splendens]
MSSNSTFGFWATLLRRGRYSSRVVSPEITVGDAESGARASYLVRVLDKVTVAAREGPLELPALGLQLSEACKEAANATLEKKQVVPSSSFESSDLLRTYHGADFSLQQGVTFSKSSSPNMIATSPTIRLSDEALTLPKRVTPYSFANTTTSSSTAVHSARLRPSPPRQNAPLPIAPASIFIKTYH